MLAVSTRKKKKSAMRATSLAVNAEGYAATLRWRILSVSKKLIGWDMELVVFLEEGTVGDDMAW